MTAGKDVRVILSLCREGLEPKSVQYKDDAPPINLSQQSQQSPGGTQDPPEPELPSQPDIPLPAAAGSMSNRLLRVYGCLMCAKSYHWCSRDHKLDSVGWGYILAARFPEPHVQSVVGCHES